MNNKEIKRLTLMATLICWLSPVNAQSLSACLQMGLTNNLDMRVAALQVQRAQAAEGSYFEMEKTELSLSQDPTSGGNPDNALMLSQKFDFPTVYSTRRKMLKAESQVEESRLRITESELTRDISSAYSTLLLWQHVSAMLTSNDSLLNEQVQTAELRCKNGESGQLELLNVKRMKAENGMMLRESIQQRTDASLVLQQLLNSEQPIVATDSFLCVEVTGQPYAFAATPQGQLSEREQARSERELNYVRQSIMPSFNVGLRHQLVLSGMNPYDVDRSRFEDGNWMGFEVGVAFPLFYGAHKAQKKAARIDVDIARTRKEAAERQAGTELLTAENAVGSARHNYNYYLTEGLPAAHEMRRLSCIEYQAGEISYLEHIQNLSSALTIEMDYAKATDALNQAIVKLNFIKGQ